MLKFILIGLLVVVIVFVIVVSLRPSRFQVTRTVSISAPPAVVFTQVNDFHNWQAWSPWAKLDPTATNTFEGSSAGKGAIMAWSGNKKVGEGRMTVTESRSTDLIRIKLDFVRPFPGTSFVEFNFKPLENQTAVTWTMTGEHNFIARAFCMFMNMDKMVGGDFERGLCK